MDSLSTGPPHEQQSHGGFDATWDRGLADTPVTPTDLDPFEAGACHKILSNALDNDLCFLPSEPRQPIPAHPKFPPGLPTPLDDPAPLESAFVGADFQAIKSSLPSPPAFKTAHQLRLPSFDVLGIANPHPDRPRLDSSVPYVPIGGGPLSKPEDPLHVLSPPCAPVQEFDGVHDPVCPSPRALGPQVEHILPIVTPPTEPGTVSWGSFVHVRPSALGSPPTSEPERSPNLATSARASTPNLASAGEVPTTDAGGTGLASTGWVRELEAILTTHSEYEKLDLVQILSHALPCPSTYGHVFGQLISTIHERTATRTSWINVFHAVPGRFTLSDLPKSPPSTPGPAVGGDEYFTSKVFDSAVAIPDYQLESKLMSPFPQPVVPPGTVNISIVERYIPPTNTTEYAEIFRLNGRSLLHDRLVELSPRNGLLVFIYPTKTGARTFMQDYLGPILDPLIRSLTIVHDLTASLGNSLGFMESIHYLNDFELLESELSTMCRSLSRTMPGESRATYQVIHASREEIMLDRESWANDWWVKQEKQRIRETVSSYFRQARKSPKSDMTATLLIQSILDGVVQRPYSDAGPRKGVEVGVFVVQKAA